jgi:hypothetical protein
MPAAAAAAASESVPSMPIFKDINRALKRLNSACSSSRRRLRVSAFDAYI